MTAAGTRCLLKESLAVRHASMHRDAKAARFSDLCDSPELWKKKLKDEIAMVHFLGGGGRDNSLLRRVRKISKSDC